MSITPNWPDRPGMADRLAAHAAPLHVALASLYGTHPGFDAWRARLDARMADACAARPAPLWQADTDFAADPAWFLRGDAIGYSAYVDRFAGSLAGIADRAGYLRGLGVRYLHLLPFWRARAGDNDGGFAVSDYRAVDPRLGRTEDLAPVADALRRAGIVLCGDLVLNHTADDHAWALAAKAGDAAKRAYYHVFADRADVDAYEATLGQVFPDTAPGNFVHVPEMGGWVWSTFYPYQYDLNYANPDVFAEMAGIMFDLANAGLGAFRLDSAAFLWKRLGTACRSLPETHRVLHALREAMAIVAPSVLLKSEVIAPVADSGAYFGTAAAPECHLAYHAGLMTAGWAALAEGRADILRAVLSAAPVPPPGAGWIAYVRCHDDIGWQTLAPQVADDQARLAAISDVFTSGTGYARGVAFQGGAGRVHGINGTAASLAGLESARTEADTTLAIARLALLHGLAYAAGGLPVLYMGDELGQTNDWSFLSDPARAHEGRWLHRPVFDEAAAAHPAGIRPILATLAQARRAWPALTPETAPRVVPGGPDALLAFHRGPHALALFNLSAADLETGVTTAGWTNLLPGDAARLPPYGMAWLIRPQR